MTALATSSIFFEQILWLWRFKTPKHETKETFSFRRFLEADKTVVVDGIKRTFRSRDCSLMLHWEYRDGAVLPIRKVRTSTFTSRVIRVVNVSTELRSTPLLRFAERSIRTVLSEARDGSCDKDDLIELISAMESHGRLDEVTLSRLAEVTRALIMENLDSLSDFKAFTKFQLYCGRWVTADEEEVARGKFDSAQKEEVRDYVSGHKSDDPDEIRAFADELDEIGDDLGVDTTRSAEKLKERAEEIEGEAEKTDEGGEERPKTKKTKAAARTKFKGEGDDEIDSMFNLMEI